MSFSSVHKSAPMLQPKMFFAGEDDILFLFFVSQIKINVELALIICVGSKYVCLWIETLCKKFQNTVQTNSQIVKNKHFKIISNHLSCYFWPLEVGQVLLTIAIVGKYGYFKKCYCTLLEKVLYILILL